VDRPDESSATSKQIETIKHLLWNGNVDEALDRIDNLFMDLDLISRQSGPAAKLAAGISDLPNNRGSIPTTASRTGREKRSARRLWNRPSTKW
jgi:hypothetical protein